MNTTKKNAPRTPDRRPAPLAVLSVVGLGLSFVLAGVAPSIAAEPFVIGGEDAPAGTYSSSLASIQGLDPETGEWEPYCAGTVISPTTILTAAHCVALMSTAPPDGDRASDLGEFRVVTGIDEVPAGADDQEPEIRRWEHKVNVSVHPGFEESGYVSSDVAVITVDEPLERVVPVVLPAPGDHHLIAPGTPTTLVGWGQLSDGTTPSWLQSATLPVLAQERCASLGDDFDPATDLCAGSDGLGACYGDSGGPLFAEHEGRIHQVGVVSRGTDETLPCAHVDNATIFTALGAPTVHDWIAQHVAA
jgi:trypsin